MARPKESNEQKVKKVYPDAKIIEDVEVDIDWANEAKIAQKNVYYVASNSVDWREISEVLYTADAAWSDALTQIRKAKIKAAKDKRKPIKVPKEIKKHVGLTMYPSDKAIIVKGFGSVQKFLDLSIREYKDKK